MLITEDTIKWVFAAIVGPAIGALFFWFSQKVWPSLQKRKDDNLQHIHKTAESEQQFTELIQTTALQQILKTQADLISHLIASNNGHLSQLTEAVTKGDGDHTSQLRDLQASFNQLLIFMSQYQSSAPVAKNAVAELMTATLRSESVKKTDAIVAAAIDIENIKK